LFISAYILSKPFKGFDSVDPRMERVPFDLRQNEIRKEYLSNHITWFLKNHNGEIEKFKESVKELYKDDTELTSPKQLKLFQDNY
ncbi:Modification methylase HpaI, partial [Candidatus Magnetobacterium bavaricum]